MDAVSDADKGPHNQVFLRPPDHTMEFVIVDIGPKFYSAIPPTTPMAFQKSRSQTCNFYVKVLRLSFQQLIFSRPYDGFGLFLI